MQRTNIALFALFAIAAVVNAGPLDPPLGPIEPTHKTLSEIEPRVAINATNTPGDADTRFIITTSGSYYLPSNVSAIALSAIEIGANARHVTIDLMGHNITSSVLGTAIRAAPSALSRSITIRNGNVRSSGGAPTTGGIFLPDVSGVVVEDVRVEGMLSGIVTGDDAIIRRCDVRLIQASTDRGGIEVGDGSIVEDCRVGDISGFGINPCIRTGSSSVVRDCVLTQNTGGERGIATGFGSIIERNVIRLGDVTPFTGIEAASICIIRGNLISAPTSATVTGIAAVSGGATIQSNTLSGCDTGVNLGSSSDSLVTGNHFRSATTAAVSASNPNSNIIGPTVGSGGAAASNNPHANYVQ